MGRRCLVICVFALGLISHSYSQNSLILFTTNLVASDGPVTIGALYVPTNYLAYIRGDFVMSGGTNYSVSSQSIAVQNSNGVLSASTPTAIAYSSSPGAATWAMGYSLFGSTNVLCQGMGVSSEPWNGQWQGYLELVPMGGLADPPPVISAVSVWSLTSSNATIVWTTDQPANSTVEWGATPAYGSITNALALTISHTIVLNNLAPSTTYHYRVSSTNSFGQSSVSVDNSFTTEPLPVQPPVISAIGASPIDPTDATIAWATDQGANSTVEWGLSTAYGMISNTLALVTAHSIGISNLVPSTTYHYRVSSTNSTGQSSVSVDNTFTTQPLPVQPPVISGIGASPIDPTDATIVWATDQAANSTVEWGLSTAYGMISNTLALVTAHSIGISNLVPSTTYHYRVSSTNSTGQSSVSVDNTFTTQPLPVQPPVIRAIGASPIDPTDATIVWATDQAANSTVEWGLSTAYGMISNTLALVTAHSIGISNLVPSTTYHYRVSSTNSTGQSSVSVDNTFTTQPLPVQPPVISGIGASPIDPTDATIVWATDQAANSTVEWGLSTAYGMISNTLALVTAHSIGISNLVPSTTYHYRVSSTNSTGQSSLSSDNSFMTAAGAGGACPLTNGLAGYWAFDNNYNDSSGMGNNLTPIQLPSFNPDGYILDCLDSFYGCAQVADNSTLAMGGDTSFTVSCWVNLQNPSVFCDIITKGSFDANGTYIIYSTGSAFRFGLGNGSAFGYVEATSLGKPQPYTWYNIVGTYDSAAHQMSIWVNNTSNAPTAWPYGTRHSTGPLSIGGAPNGTYHWNGLIDEVILWTNRALTSTEIGQVYTNANHELTPLNYCSDVNGRNVVIFNGDARFATTATNTNMPNYFMLYSWVSNHNATVVNYSGGVPPPTPPYVEQIDDLTNAAMTSTVLSYVGPGTNVYWVTEIGINDIYIMQNTPLYGYWTASTMAYQLTNYFNFLSNAGVKVIPLTIYPLIGLENSPGDGTLATGEQVRQYVNAAITNYTGAFAILDVTPWLQTNNVPMWWGPSESELNDLGNTNVAMHLNALMNQVAP